MKGSQQRLQRWVKCCLMIALMIACAGQAGAATYYVATNGSDANAGTSTGSPWRHIYYAASKALAGDTVYIKGGSYGNEKAVVTHAGSSGSPITFEGYSGTVNIGTLPGTRTIPATTEVGFKMTSKPYITLRNLNFTWYYDCVQVNSSDHVTIDNITVNKCGSTGGLGSGIYVNYSDYVTITDCTITDAGGNNIFLAYCNNCTVSNCNQRGTLSGSDQWATDYYFVMRACSNCTVSDCVSDDTVDSNKGNHGFIIKDLTFTPHSTGNVIQDCTAYSMEEGFSVAHLAYGNTFLRCNVDNSAKGTTGYNTCFQARNGAYNNTFRECNGTGRKVVASFANYNEGNLTTKSGNKFINCLLKGSDYSGSIGVFYDGTSNNEFENCVFDKVVYFGRWVHTNTGNKFKNCIIYSIPTKYDPQNLAYPYGGVAGYDGSGALTATYNCFYDNGFAALSGTGNFTDNPDFVSASDYHLQSTAGHWTAGGWVTDAQDSPCIDTGDPASAYANEPDNNGGRINIGRYGNTVQASKSPGGAPAADVMDNRMKDTSPTTVYGTNTFLDIGYNASNTSKYRDLLRFNLTPYLDDDPNSITDAKLSLYWYYPSATRAADTVVGVYKPASGWTHDYACWSNKASGVAWTNAGGDWTDVNGVSQGTTPYASNTFPAATLPTNQYYDWNVTTLLRDYVTGDYNNGFLIKASAEATNNNYIAFYGTANATYRPKLSITRIASQTEGTAASDNRLRQAAPTTVYLTSTYNDVGYLAGTGAFRDIVWFDLTPFADVETITSAKLSLYWYHPPTTRTNDTIVDIYRPASGWNKDYVCWSNKASGVAWTNAGGDWYDANSTAQGSTPFATVTFDNAQVATNQYYTFDVTALVNYYRSSGTNAGFFIKARTESDNYIGFYSLNNTDYKPKLEVTSTVVQP